MDVGCATQSVIYSPTCNLPPKPLEQGDVQFLCGIGEMPEARPHKSKEETAKGFEGTFRIAAFDWLSLQIKYWKDISDNDKVSRNGYAFSTIFIPKKDLYNFDIGIMPEAIFLYGDGSCLGGGGMLRLCTWAPNISIIHIYGSLGYGYGVHDAYDVGDKWGWLIVGNIGSSILLFDHITFNLELSAVKQYNNYEDLNDHFLIPSWNVGIKFDPFY